MLGDAAAVPQHLFDGGIVGLHVRRQVPSDRLGKRQVQPLDEAQHERRDEALRHAAEGEWGRRRHRLSAVWIGDAGSSDPRLGLSADDRSADAWRARARPERVEHSLERGRGGSRGLHSVSSQPCGPSQSVTTRRAVSVTEVSSVTRL